MSEDTATCPNGHGLMTLRSAPLTPHGPTGRYWVCLVCHIERMWPDPPVPATAVSEDTAKPDLPFERLAEELIAIYGSCLSQSKDPTVKRGAHPGEECVRLFVRSLEAAVVPRVSEDTAKPDQEHAELLAALHAMVASASPNRTEHPTMYAAWEQAKAAIAGACTDCIPRSALVTLEQELREKIDPSPGTFTAEGFNAGLKFAADKLHTLLAGEQD